MKLVNIGILALSLSAIGAANAGVSSSGGAGVVVCGQKVQLLDTFEAEHRGLDLEPDLGSLRQNYRLFTVKVLEVSESSRATDNNYVDAFTDSNLNSLYKSNFKFLPPGTDLASTNDFGVIPELPEGCALRQLAVYKDSNHEIEIDSDFWEALNWRDRAAMIAHELLYRSYRESGDTTSENTRKMVGDFFSTKKMPTIFEGVPSTAASFSANSYEPAKNDINGKMFPTQYGTRIRFDRLNDYNLYEPHGADIGISINKKFMELRMDRDSKLRVYVTDPTANYHQIVKISGGSFDGYSLEVMYQYQMPMEFKLFTPSGILISTSTLDSYREID